MYNEEQKERFMKYCENNKIYNFTSINLIRSIFNSTQKSEEQFGKDICDFSATNVLDLFKGFNSKSRTRIRNNCVYLTQYYEWCKMECIVDSMINPFDYKTIDPLLDFIITKDELNEKYFTKTKFLQMLDDILDVSNQFIAYAIYCGLTIDELVNLKIEDLDFENNTLALTVTDRIISVDTLFKHLIIQANDQTQYFPDGIKKESKRHAYNYADSPYVLKTCLKGYTDPVRTYYIYKRISVISNQVDNKLMSLAIIYKNGLINHIKEHYKRQNISLKEALLDKINGKLYTYDIETQKCIDEFGSSTKVRILRYEIQDYIDLM